MQFEFTQFLVIIQNMPSPLIVYLRTLDALSEGWSAIDFVNYAKENPDDELSIVILEGNDPMEKAMELMNDAFEIAHNPEPFIDGLGTDDVTKEIYRRYFRERLAALNKVERKSIFYVRFLLKIGNDAKRGAVARGYCLAFNNDDAVLLIREKIKAEYVAWQIGQLECVERISVNRLDDTEHNPESICEVAVEKETVVEIEEWGGV